LRTLAGLFPYAQAERVTLRIDAKARLGAGPQVGPDGGKLRGGLAPEGGQSLVRFSACPLSFLAGSIGDACERVASCWASQALSSTCAALAWARSRSASAAAISERIKITRAMGCLG
jgi:hypothetical protein